jgi:diacylglycerol kinase
MGPTPPRPQRAASRLSSFRHAFTGWAYVLRSQPNARLHAAATVAVAGLAAWLRPGRAGCVALVLTVGLVWVAECVNTAVEATVDLASPGLHPLARAAKDAAAAAVLIAALTAVAVGLLVLGPPLWARLAP